MEFTSKWMIFLTLNSIFVMSCLFLQTWIQMKFQAILKIVKRRQEIGGNTRSGTGIGTGSCIDRKGLNYHQIIPKVCSPANSLSP